jgi:hypothetical protein
MQNAEPTSPATAQRWETLSKSLARVGVETSVVFGLPCLKLGGKAFAALFGNALVLQMSDALKASTLRLEGAALFAPTGAARVMKDWVLIPDTHFKSWGSLTASAMTALATTMPARKRQPKKWPRRLS